MENTLLDKLNPAQRAAATFGTPGEARGWSSPPLLVVAGAGTGKTNTLAHRVAHLILNGVAPERVLLLTFSRRAAQELARRAQGIVADALASASGNRTAVRLPWAGTFHSVANRLLRQYAAQVGLAPGFSVMDRGDAADLLDVVAPGTRAGGEGPALSAQGHLSRDLFALRQHPGFARRHAD